MPSVGVQVWAYRFGLVAEPSAGAWGGATWDFL